MPQSHHTISLRFIPTCMGNSRRNGAGGSIKPVHPHVHGELLSAGDREALSTGSSPRAWGTLADGRRCTSAGRFIPTCMGNSRLDQLLLPHPTVHPHVHGELAPAMVAYPSRNGSSPRAWGTHEPPQSALSFLRFIPTCMGNSSMRPPASG